METLFSKLLTISILAGAVIFVSFALRFAFKKAPRWIRCAMDGLACVCLLFSFSSVSELGRTHVGSFTQLLSASAKPLYAASAQSPGPVSVALATDELLKKYPSRSELAILLSGKLHAPESVRLFHA